MSGIFIPTLYAMSGVCAFAALRHGLAVMQRRVSPIHLLFAGLSLTMMVLILAKAGAYLAPTVQELIALRKWEISAVSLVFMVFPWFVGRIHGRPSAELLLGLTVFWIVIFIVNLRLPYGVQFADLPRLTYFELPWGERVVDCVCFSAALGTISAYSEFSPSWRSAFMHASPSTGAGSVEERVHWPGAWACFSGRPVQPGRQPGVHRVRPSERLRFSFHAGIDGPGDDAGIAQ